MTTEQVLRTARERGIRLHPEGDGLRYKAPPGALTDDLRTELVTHKAEILKTLARGDTHPCGHCGRFAFREPTVCYWCRTTKGAHA